MSLLDYQIQDLCKSEILDFLDCIGSSFCIANAGRHCAFPFFFFLNWKLVPKRDPPCTAVASGQAPPPPPAAAGHPQVQTAQQATVMSSMAAAMPTTYSGYPTAPQPQTIQPAVTVHQAHCNQFEFSAVLQIVLHSIVRFSTSDIR